MQLSHTLHLVYNTQQHAHIVTCSIKSINEHHKVDATFAARRQHASVQNETMVIRGFTNTL